MRDTVITRAGRRWLSPNYRLADSSARVTYSRGADVARLRRQDWCLLVLGAAEGTPMSPVQLQKSLFLIGENVKPVERRLSDDFYAFEPFDYGPFDREAYSDAERLEAEGLVCITQHPSRSYRQYAATSTGVERAKKLGDALPPDVLEYIQNVAQWALARSFNEIVRAIYRQYPEQRARSVFRG